MSTEAIMVPAGELRRVIQAIFGAKGYDEHSPWAMSQKFHKRHRGDMDDEMFPMTAEDLDSLIAMGKMFLGTGWGAEVCLDHDHYERTEQKRGRMTALETLERVRRGGTSGG